MAVQMTTGLDGSIMVWLVLEVGGSPQDEALIGQGTTADVALSGAVANLGEAVQDLANRQRLSAVEDYKRREPV